MSICCSLVIDSLVASCRRQHIFRTLCIIKMLNEKSLGKLLIKKKILNLMNMGYISSIYVNSRPMILQAKFPIEVTYFLVHMFFFNSYEINCQSSRMRLILP